MFHPKCLTQNCWPNLFDPAFWPKNLTQNFGLGLIFLAPKPTWLSNLPKLFKFILRSNAWGGFIVLLVMFGPNRESVPGVWLESQFWRPEGLDGGGLVIAAHSKVYQVNRLLSILSLFHFSSEAYVVKCLLNISGVILYISWSVLQYKSSPDHSILETPPRGRDHYSILEPLDSRLSIPSILY